MQERRGGERRGAGIQRHSVVGGEAILIALKVTRLRRPTLTRYPYCRQQTEERGPEEQRPIDFWRSQTAYESVVRGPAPRWKNKSTIFHGAAVM